jgi:hypothetical protein
MVDELVTRLAYESTFSRRQFIAGVGVGAATAVFAPRLLFARSEKA